MPFLSKGLDGCRCVYYNQGFLLRYLRLMTTDSFIQIWFVINILMTSQLMQIHQWHNCRIVALEKMKLVLRKKMTMKIPQNLQCVFFFKAKLEYIFIFTKFVKIFPISHKITRFPPFKLPTIFIAFLNGSVKQLYRIGMSRHKRDSL